MSRNVRGIGIVLATGAAAAYFLPSIFNPARTTAVQNIEARYTSGGATPEGEKATATRRGDMDNVYTDAERNDQVRKREQRDDLEATDVRRRKGDTKVVARRPPEERPR